MKSIKKLALCAFAVTAFASCEKETETITVTKDLSVQLPEKYEFDSRFSIGLSSVSYTGQTVRNMLVADIKNLLDDAATTTNISLKSDILNLFNYSDNRTQSLITAGSFTLVNDVYDDISTGKNLDGKINSETVIGYSNTAEDLFLAWVDTIDNNINVKGYTGKDIFLTADSVDLSQMIHKTLLGSVVYNQGTDNYLDRVINDDNTSAKDGTAAYSVMEHTWDEAFGYYGAARNYFNFTDDDLAGKNGGVTYKDDDADSKIDLRSEYNFGFSTNAGKRDRVINDGGIDPMFTTQCFEAFLAGRTAIANQRDSSEIRGYAENACQSWEKVIAATAVHYINDTKSDLAERKSGGTIGNKYDLYKHWAEMRAFVLMLQYGAENYQLIDDSDIQDIVNLMGNEVASVIAGGDSAIDDYIDDLDEAANLLRLIYNFEQSNVDNWRVSR